MKRVSTATRLSISLAVLTVSVLLAAQSVGLVPDPARAAMKGRKALCESMAIHGSLAAQQGDARPIRDAAEAIIARNADVLSIGLRRTDGELIVESGAHAANWVTPRDGDTSAPAASARATADQVVVPIFQGDDRWGSMEIRFRRLSAGGVWGMLAQPVVRLSLFVAVIGFGAYLFYLRKTLRYLDPTSVIPERVRAMLDTLAEGVLVLDRRERIVMANEAFAAMIGRPSASLQGLAAASLNWADPGAKAALTTFPWSKTLKEGTAQKGVALMLRGGQQAAEASASAAPSPAVTPAPAPHALMTNWDQPETLVAAGGPRLVTVNCSPIVADNAEHAKGPPRGVLLTFDDVTQVEATNGQLREALDMLGRSRDEIERQNQELQALATTDPLTGCRNRRSFHAQFQTQWAAAQRYGHSLACVMVDVDFFKKINDVHGHSTGDLVLQHVANVLKSLARESDVVCRFGGEEFCVLLPQSDVSSAAQAAERYRAAIESRPCGGISVTASVGCSAMHLGAAAPQEMLDQADKSLYAAKRRGRNRVVRWDEIRGTAEAEAPEPAKPAAPPARETGVVGRAHAPIAFNAVTALMSALAHRDHGTAEHCQRVADLCVATANRGEGPLKGLSVKQRFLIEMGALLHDIGKLGVPDAVLLKPGALTDDEWKIMRSHDRMGVEIIAAAFGTAELTEIVRTHHASFAGDPNEPAMPAGEKIALGARLLALADAYDAMISDRPYRGARDRDAAFAELRRCAGAQFDPALVEPFIAAVSAMPFYWEPGLGSSAKPPALFGAAPQAGRISDQSALRIRLEIERLACAAEAKDLTTLAETARQLAEIASGDGLPHLAERLSVLERAAGPELAAPGHPAPPEPDMERLVSLTSELLELSRSPQGLNREPAEVPSSVPSA